MSISALYACSHNNWLSLNTRMQVKSPLLIIHGAADRVTDPQVSKFLYENASSEDKSLKLYDQGFHCILEGEPDDRIFEVLNDMLAWLDSHSTKS